jgi:hypothetical protein
MQPWLSFRVAAIDRQHPGAITTKGRIFSPRAGGWPTAKLIGHSQFLGRLALAWRNFAARSLPKLWDYGGE